MKLTRKYVEDYTALKVPGSIAVLLSKDSRTSSQLCTVPDMRAITGITTLLMGSVFKIVTAHSAYLILSVGEYGCLVYYQRYPNADSPFATAYPSTVNDMFWTEVGDSNPQTLESFIKVRDASRVRYLSDIHRWFN